MIMFTTCKFEHHAGRGNKVRMIPEFRHDYANCSSEARSPRLDTWAERTRCRHLVATFETIFTPLFPLPLVRKQCVLTHMPRRHAGDVGILLLVVSLDVCTCVLKTRWHAKYLGNDWHAGSG